MMSIIFLYVCYLTINLNIFFLVTQATCSDSIRSKERSTSISETMSRRLSKISMASLTRNVQQMKAFQWFLEPQFYLVACTYGAARLFSTVSQSYIIFYVHFTLRLPEEYIAMIPLSMFIAGFLISVLLKFVTNIVGLKMAFLLSCIIGIGMLILLLYR